MQVNLNLKDLRTTFFDYLYLPTKKNVASREQIHLGETGFNAPFQVQIGAVIQTAYCSSSKFIIAFERRMRKNHLFRSF